MKKWEQFEEYLFEHNVLGENQFTSKQVAKDMGLTGPDASEMIQSYLAQQRSPKSKALFVLSRSERTSNTVWHIGTRKGDVQRVTRQTTDDIRTRLVNAVAPDLQRMVAKNPRAAMRVEGALDVFMGVVKQLVGAFDE